MRARRLQRRATRAFPLLGSVSTAFISGGLIAHPRGQAVPGGDVRYTFRRAADARHGRQRPFPAIPRWRPRCSAWVRARCCLSSSAPRVTGRLRSPGVGVSHRRPALYPADARSERRALEGDFLATKSDSIGRDCRHRVQALTRDIDRSGCPDGCVLALGARMGERLDRFWCWCRGHRGCHAPFMTRKPRMNSWCACAAARSADQVPPERGNFGRSA